MRSGTINSTLTRGYGTLGGLGLIGAAVFAVPSTLLLEPRPPAEAYFSTVAALLTGLVCMALPWERIDPRWLHLFGVLATAEAAWAVAVFGQAYLALFFLVAVAIAYVTPTMRILVPHLAFIGLAIFAPVAYGPEDARSTAQVGLVVFPLLVLTAGLFAYLRQRMVADHRAYRLFAQETLALADRIAGYSLASQQAVPARELDDLPDLSRFRVSERALTVVAAILAVPLLSAALAAAGVKLPGFATETFGVVGIELPNQSLAEEPAIHRAADAEGAQGAKRRSGTAKRPAAGDARAATDPAHSAGPGAGGGAVTSDPASGGVAGGDAPSAYDAATAPQAGVPGAPDTDEPSDQDPVGGAVEDTMAGLNEVLGAGGRATGEETPPAEEPSAE